MKAKIANVKQKQARAKRARNEDPARGSLHDSLTNDQFVECLREAVKMNSTRGLKIHFSFSASRSLRGIYTRYPGIWVSWISRYGTKPRTAGHLCGYYGRGFREGSRRNGCHTCDRLFSAPECRTMLRILPWTASLLQISYLLGRMARF